MQYSKGKRYSKSSSKKLNKIISIDSFLKAVLVLLLFYTGASLLFGDRNVFSYFKKVKQEKSLISEINRLKQEKLSLLEKKRYLEKDIFYIEKRAREDLGLKKENEDIYVIVEKNETSDNLADKTQRWIDRILKAYKEK